MKTIKSTILCLLLVTLLVGSVSVQAVEAQAPAQTEQPFSNFFLNSLTTNVRWNSHLAVDSEGGIHAVLIAENEIFYAYCLGSCSSSDDWHGTSFLHQSIPDSMHPTLILDRNDHPRIMVSMGSEYLYAECNFECSAGFNWQTTAVPIAGESRYDHYFALDSEGRPRFVVSATDGVRDGFRYGFCNTNCTQSENWDSVFVEAGYITAPQLNLTAGGLPRVMGLWYGIKLAYIECNANCETTGAWKSAMIYDGTDIFSFRLNSKGKPRVAFYGPDEADPKIYYAWNNGNALNEGDWNNYARNLPTNREAVAMVLDSQGKPHFAYVSDQTGLSYSECSADCETMSAVWQDQSIETAAELEASDPSSPYPECQLEGWQLGKKISLALDSSDRARMSYDVSYSETCTWNPTNPRYGVAIRFAKSEKYVPATTAPESVSIHSAEFGSVDTPIIITAEVSPADTSVPITYEWTATGLEPITNTFYSRSDTTFFIWPKGTAGGKKTIQVTASNELGSVTQTVEINILGAPLHQYEWIFLPFLRQ